MSAKNIRYLALATAAAFSGVTLAGDGTLVYGNVAGWTIHTVPADGYACFAEAEYEGGSRLRLSLGSAGHGVAVAVSDPSWPDTLGDAEAVVSVRFDDGPQQAHAAKASIRDGGLILDFSPTPAQAFVERFEKSVSVSFGFADHEPVELSLGGSSRAMRLLERCQTTMPQGG